jgi:hypothetical protein
MHMLQVAERLRCLAKQLGKYAGLASRISTVVEDLVESHLGEVQLIIDEIELLRSDVTGVDGVGEAAKLIEVAVDELKAAPPWFSIVIEIQDTLLAVAADNAVKNAVTQLNIAANKERV